MEEISLHSRTNMRSTLPSQDHLMNFQDSSTAVSRGQALQTTTPTSHMQEEVSTLPNLENRTISNSNMVSSNELGRGKRNRKQTNFFQYQN